MRDCKTPFCLTLGPLQGIPLRAALRRTMRAFERRSPETTRNNPKYMAQKSGSRLINQAATISPIRVRPAPTMRCLILPSSKLRPTIVSPAGIIRTQEKDEVQLC